MKHPIWIRLLFSPLVALAPPGAILADDVLPGYDLFQTVSGAGETYQDFSGPFVIPADFFGPRSHPFPGKVELMGVPLGSHPGCAESNLGLADTIVERLRAATLPDAGSSDTIPIEIVALSLVSVSPIPVFYGEASDTPEMWDLRVELSPSRPSTGMMTIHHSSPDGGTFDSVLTVRPLLVFKRQIDGATRTLDAGAFGLSDTFVATGVPWTHSCDDGTVVRPACTANFCASFSSIDGKVFTGELATLAAHGIIPACPAPLTIQPGFDLFSTPAGGTTYVDFTESLTIPAEFFGPGCASFSGRVELQGAPMPSHPACPYPGLGTTDTIVARQAEADLPSVGMAHTIPTEMVALSLESTQPITVLCPGGAQQWDVVVNQSSSAPSTGSMTIRRTHPRGGTFDSVFIVQPLFTFTNVANGEMRQLDGGAQGISDVLQSVGAPWEDSCPPEVVFRAPCSANFCASFSAALGGVLTSELGRLSAHGVVPAAPLNCPSCNDGNPCTHDVCNLAGECQNVPLSDESSCSDGDVCNGAETCAAGVCTTGAPLDCNDGNTCTADSCAATTGCYHRPGPPVCDDGNPCTADACTEALECVGTPLPDTENATGADGICGTPDDNNLLNGPDGVCGTADDSTGDGVCEDIDTCAAHVSPQTDSDGDGLGDACDCAPFQAGTPIPGPVGDTLQVTRDPATGQTRLAWERIPVASFYDTYRGTIPGSLMGSRNNPYDHLCYELDDAFGDGFPVSSDGATPAVGSAFYYDIVAVNGCGEGPPGSASDGTPRTSIGRCPSIPIQKGAIAGRVLMDVTDPFGVSTGLAPGIDLTVVLLHEFGHGLGFYSFVSKTADLFGNYSFADLYPGDYVVRVFAPDGRSAKMRAPVLNGAMTTVNSLVVPQKPEGVFGSYLAFPYDQNAGTGPDIDNSGLVDLDDIKAVLSCFVGGSPPDCPGPADVNRDGSVDESDILAVLSSFARSSVCVGCPYQIQVTDGGTMVNIADGGTIVRSVEGTTTGVFSRTPNPWVLQFQVTGSSGTLQSPELGTFNFRENSADPSRMFLDLNSGRILGGLFTVELSGGPFPAPAQVAGAIPDGFVSLAPHGFGLHHLVGINGTLPEGFPLFPGANFLMAKCDPPKPRVLCVDVQVQPGSPICSLGGVACAAPGAPCTVGGLCGQTCTTIVIARGGGMTECRRCSCQ